MPEYVRVRDDGTGHELTIRKSQLGDGMTKIDKPALSPSGEPAPVLYRTKLGTPRPGSKQDRKRESTKTSEATSPGDSAGHTSASPKKEN